MIQKANQVIQVSTIQKGIRLDLPKIYRYNLLIPKKNVNFQPNINVKYETT